MRRTLSLLASAAAVVVLFAVMPAQSAAVLNCPDDMIVVPEDFVNQGHKKDHNGNDFVCAKPTTCLEPSGPVCHGGPDDDEIVGTPLRGADGEWYYVIDDV